jgi:hypothetical protein
MAVVALSTVDSVFLLFLISGLSVCIADVYALHLLTGCLY